METPSSSIRRMTRSQTVVPAINSANSSAIQKIEESEKGCTKSRQRALIDITNDSPIVGLAMGKLETPSSLISKKMVSNQEKQQQDMTPGSGEALLRCQVKNLLQKVEEEAEISKISSDDVPMKPLLLHLGSQFLISPSGLLAPTPANTPHIFGNPSGINNIGLASIQESKSEIEISPPQAESEKEVMVTRSLMLEFSEKSEGTYSSGSSSVVTYQGGESQGKVDKSGTEDDSSSIWSIQVNASTKDDHETDVEEEIEDDEEDYYFDVETELESDGAGGVDELCEAISQINVNGNGQAKFCGKHTKFVYNSDDELEEEEVVVSSSISSSDGLRLQGWPTPKGKHIRLQMD